MMSSSLSHLSLLFSVLGLVMVKLFTFLLYSSSSFSMVAFRVSPADSSMAFSDLFPLLHLCGAEGIGVDAVKLQLLQKRP